MVYLLSHPQFNVCSSLLNVFDQIHVHLGTHNIIYPWLSLPAVGRNQSSTPIFVSDIIKLVLMKQQTTVPHM